MSISAVPRPQISHSHQDSHVGASTIQVVLLSQLPSRSIYGGSRETKPWDISQVSHFSVTFHSSVRLGSPCRTYVTGDRKTQVFKIQGCLTKPEDFIAYYGLKSFGKYLQPRPYRQCDLTLAAFQVPTLSSNHCPRYKHTYLIDISSPRSLITKK